MIYLILLNFLLIIGVVYYFDNKISKKISVIDLNYPKTIIKPFLFTDLDDYETSIIDIINLIILEENDWDSINTGGDKIVFVNNKNDLALIISYDKEKLGNNFKIQFNRFEFGKGYQRQYRWVDEIIVNFSHSENINKSLNNTINKFIHNIVYNHMVDEREITKKEILKKKSLLDDILSPITRDRKIDTILNKKI